MHNYRSSVVKAVFSLVSGHTNTALMKAGADIFFEAILVVHFLIIGQAIRLFRIVLSCGRCSCWLPLETCLRRTENLDLVQGGFRQGSWKLMVNVWCAGYYSFDRNIVDVSFAFYRVFLFCGMYFPPSWYFLCFLTGFRSLFLPPSLHFVPLCSRS